jgi:hypothetical protein
MWLAGAMVIAASWLASAALWGMDVDENYGSFSEWRFSMVVLAFASAVAALAAWLTRRRSRARGAGFVVIGVLVAGLAYNSLFAFFGGFCMDADDICQTTWSSRSISLTAGLVPMGVGWFVQRLSDPRARGGVGSTGHRSTA